MEVTQSGFGFSVFRYVEEV